MGGGWHYWGGPLRFTISHQKGCSPFDTRGVMQQEFERLAQDLPHERDDEAEKKALDACFFSQLSEPTF